MGVPIRGWPAIAEAARKAVGSASLSERTARRYAARFRPNRLPVYKWPNGCVYLDVDALSQWAALETAGFPTRGALPGRPPVSTATRKRA